MGVYVDMGYCLADIGVSDDERGGNLKKNSNFVSFSGERYVI